MLRIAPEPMNLMAVSAVNVFYIILNINYSINIASSPCFSSICLKQSHIFFKVTFQHKFKKIITSTKLFFFSVLTGSAFQELDSEIIKFNAS